MQVTKLRIANDNGLVPAGRYFSRLSEALREANERAADVVDIYEQQQRKRQTRHRRASASPASTSLKRQIEMALN
jgi:hypothetical protein